MAIPIQRRGGGARPPNSEMPTRESSSGAHTHATMGTGWRGCSNQIHRSCQQIAKRARSLRGAEEERRALAWQRRTRRDVMKDTSEDERGQGQGMIAEACYWRQAQGQIFITPLGQNLYCHCTRPFSRLECRSPRKDIFPKPRSKSLNVPCKVRRAYL